MFLNESVYKYNLNTIISIFQIKAFKNRIQQSKTDSIVDASKSSVGDKFFSFRYISVHMVDKVYWKTSLYFNNTNWLVTVICLACFFKIIFELGLKSSGGALNCWHVFGKEPFLRSHKHEKIKNKRGTIYGQNLQQ